MGAPEFAPLVDDKVPVETVLMTVELPPVGPLLGAAVVPTSLVETEVETEVEVTVVSVGVGAAAE